MFDKLNELPYWISRGLDDLFPFNDAGDSDQLKVGQMVSVRILREENSRLK